MLSDLTRRAFGAAHGCHAATRLTFAVMLFGASGLLMSCDPCAGVMACGVSPRVAVQGRIVDTDNGHAAARARISLIRVSGDRRDSTSTLTDEQGNYNLWLASETGAFDLQVEPV